MSDPKPKSLEWPNRNILGYYAFQLFANLSFWLPIYAVFFLVRDLSYSAILLLYAIDTAVQTTLELPSGVLSDRWGRKPVLMLGTLLNAAGFSCIAFGGHIGFYALGMVCHGAGMAFISGSDSAFIFDTLKAAGRADEYRKIEGRGYMYNLLGWGIGGLLGGFLAAEELTIPYIASAFASFLAFLVIAMAAEPPRSEEEIKNRPSTRKLVSSAFGILKTNRVVLGIIVLASIIMGFLLIGHKFSQPYLIRAGIDIKYFGVVYFFWLMSAATASYFSEKIESILGYKVYFIVLPLIVGGVYVYWAFLQNLGGVVVALAYQAVWGSLRPQMNQIINQEVDSSMRATLLSGVGFGSAIVYVIGAPIYGWLADSYRLPVALILLGATIIVAGFAAVGFLLQHYRGQHGTAHGFRFFFRE